MKIHCIWWGQRASRAIPAAACHPTCLHHYHCSHHHCVHLLLPLVCAVHLFLMGLFFWLGKVSQIPPKNALVSLDASARGGGKQYWCWKMKIHHIWWDQRASRAVPAQPLWLWRGRDRIPLSQILCNLVDLLLWCHILCTIKFCEWTKIC